MVEYLGDFPYTVAARECETSNGEFVGTNPELFWEVYAKCQTSADKLRTVLSNIQTAASADELGVRNLKQAQNVAYRCVQKERVQKGLLKRGRNLADDVLHLCNRVASGDDFLKTVHIVSGHSPCVLYTDKQISDICRFCGADG